MISGIHGVMQFAESQLTAEIREMTGAAAGILKLATRGKKDIPKSDKKGVSWMMDVMDYLSLR